MTTQANLILENRIRKGLRLVRFFVAYAPFGMVRRMQHVEA